MDKWSFLSIIDKASLIDKKSKKSIFSPSLDLGVLFGYILDELLFCYSRVRSSLKIRVSQGHSGWRQKVFALARRWIYSGLILRPWICGGEDILGTPYFEFWCASVVPGIVALVGDVVTCLRSGQWSDPDGPVGPSDQRMGEHGCTLALSPKITMGHRYPSKLWGTSPRPGQVIWLPQTPATSKTAVQYSIIIIRINNYIHNNIDSSFLLVF